jgi:hypothetical protein
MAMKWFLTIFAILALGAAIAGPFFGSVYVSGVGLVGFVGLLITANLDRLAEFKASKSGIEARTREIFARAEVTIDQLQRLAKTVASQSLSLVQRTGRWGGYTDQEQKKIYDDAIDVLRRIGVAQSDLESIATDWHRVVEFDYAHFILGGHIVPEGLDAPAMEEWNSLRNGGFEKVPTPQQLRDFMEKHGFLSERIQQLLEDYEYYRVNKSHRREQIWASRTKWGRLNRDAAA